MTNADKKSPPFFKKLLATVKSIKSGQSAPPQTNEASKTIIVVSGLPRSGTSMMMKMLQAGGISPLTDEIRAADTDNPQGYYEFERVKKMDKGDTAWLANAQGKAVKVISMLLKHLSPTYNYKIIFMRRQLEETLASQKQMLVRREKPAGATSDEEMADLFRQHLNQVESWLAAQPNMAVIYIDYNQTLADPTDQANQINHFLGNTLDVNKMIGVIDPTLYRQRKRGPNAQ